MKTINKYIIFNFISIFLVYLLIVAFLIFINYLYQILNSLLLHRPDFYTTITLFVYLVPTVLSLTIPITFLLSIIICVSTLNENKELLILHTMGLNKFSYTKNLFLVAMFISLILVYFNAYVVPTTYKNFKSIYFKQIVSRPFINFKDNSIINLENKKIFTQKVEENKIYGIYIHNFIDNTTLQTIYAKEATIYTDVNGDIIFYLNNGKINTINTKLPDEILNLMFKQYKFYVYKSEINKFVPYNKTFREMDNKELLEEFNNSKLPKYKKLVLSEYFLRYTLSLSVIFFSLIGVFLGSRIKRNAKSISFVVSILIILIYYFMLSTSLTIVERVENLPLSFVSIVMQLPNFTILVIYVILLIIQKIGIIL